MGRVGSVGRAPQGARGSAGKGRKKQASLADLRWRVERLERQVSRLSELVRQHAMDADRLVQIVAEDREVLLEELLRRRAALTDNQPAPPGAAPKYNGAS